MRIGTHNRVKPTWSDDGLEDPIDIRDADRSRWDSNRVHRGDKQAGYDTTKPTLVHIIASGI